MKIGVNLRIDVTKLDKSRFFKGQKGIYADMTAFIDTENVSEYGDNGTISQAQSQEERQAGAKLPIIGNAKIFWKGESETTVNNQAKESGGGSDEDLPF